MPAKRDLDMEAVKRLRESGATWQDVAGQLGWNVSALRERLQRDGYFAMEYKQKYTQNSPQIEVVDGVPIDWESAEKLFMAGCEIKDVAAAFGVNEDYFAERYKKSANSALPALEYWVEQCRAKGRCALKLAQYEALLRRKVDVNV